jgi:histidyl-tRNA synthetase
MSINAPRGTNDVLPPVSLKWQYVLDKASELMKRYNYKEIKTPLFEYTELFQRGIGEVTDIVEKEMYTFEDKGGRSLTLRPEGTASVMRSFMEHKIYGKAQPTKYYYFGPMFRYERPQAGRYRQHNQLGAEVLGSNDPAVDAELISLGLNFLSELQLDNVEVYINSIGCNECRVDYLDTLKEYMVNHKDGLCDICQDRLERNPLRILDCKNDSCSTVVKNAPKITNYLCDECQDHFNQVQDYLDRLKVNYIVDPTLVRGLDYYTNTAFEIKYSGLGAQDTVFAGGRYNGLADEVGGRSVPGIGFAIGIERLLLTLEEEGIELPIDDSIDLYITTIGEKAKKRSFELLSSLRKSGFRAEIDYLGRSVGSQMKAADRMDATYTIIIGGDELKSGKATVRNMKSGEESEIVLDQLTEEMQKFV